MTTREEILEHGDEVPDVVRAVHPLAIYLGQCIVDTDGSNGEPLAINPGAYDELLKELKALIPHGEEFRHAMTSLLACAVSLKDQGAPQASQWVIDLITEQELQDAMIALGPPQWDEDAEATKKTSEQFQSFADNAEEKRAPQEGEEAPDDAVKVDKLDFPRRI